MILFVSLPTQAEEKSISTNDAALTGESVDKAKDSATNQFSSPTPSTATNSATLSVATQAKLSSSGALPPPTHVATLISSDLREYALQSPQVQRLIDRALKLTTQNLNYQYGSSDPASGGMDCSGTVYFLLKDIGLKDVPRDAGGLYKWVWLSSHFMAVTSPNPNTFELDPLKPGDLLFWTGTYAIDRDPPVTHVMIYLGINRQSGKRVMVGASEGRRFNEKPQYGVSVFDFEMPGKKRVDKPAPMTNAEARFIGYGSIPGIEQVDGAPNTKS
jgi:cell wall-associated NlpC family hydrolase